MVAPHILRGLTTRLGRLGLVAILALLLAVAGIAYWLSVNRAPTPGPLQPSDVVISNGMWGADGALISFVVGLRAEEPVTATLDAIALASPDPGLVLEAAGILVNGYPGTDVAPFFPLGPLEPLEGKTITTTPGDPAGDLFFNLGIRLDSDESPQSVRGVWLDYHVGATNHRALIPWLLTVCPTPITGICTALPGNEFSFPPR